MPDVSYKLHCFIVWERRLVQIFSYLFEFSLIKQFTQNVLFGLDILMSNEMIIIRYERCEMWIIEKKEATNICVYWMDADDGDSAVKLC